MVIQIAEEIIDQNKPLTTEILYNKAKKRLNLSRRGLLSIIQLLFNKKILVEGSKYTKKSILLNPYRKIIFNFIHNNIGAHFSLIRKGTFSGEETKASPGQLIWHLEMLLKFKYIKKVKVGNYTIFLPIEIDEQKGKLYFLLRDELTKKIITLLLEKEPIKKSEIYKLLDQKRELVYYRINNLKEDKIINLMKKEEKGLYLNSNKKKLIKEILNIEI